MQTTIARKKNYNSDDLELINGLAKGKPEAFEELYKKHAVVLRAVIMQILHDEAEADDVLQDVLTQLWQGAGNYSVEKGRLMGWLVTVARRRAIDRLRQHSAYRRATDRYEVSCNHADKEVAQLHPVEHQAYTDEIRKMLEEHLSHLPENQRVAIRMVYFENRSQREISVMTHTPLGTVKTRIELGMKKLSHALNGMRDHLIN